MIKNVPLSNNSQSCQNYYPDLICLTSTDPRRALLLRRYWWRLKKTIWHIQVLGLVSLIKKKLSFKHFRKSVYQKGERMLSNKACSEDLNLQPGDLVEVRSEKEIFATLDQYDKHKRLQFTREMRKYCGKRFRVYKKVEKILVESTGKLRSLKIPTVILEGVICDGSAHGGCDRTCFCFWREIWLKRIAEESTNCIIDNLDLK